MKRKVFLGLLLLLGLLVSGCSEFSGSGGAKLYVSGWLYLNEGVKTFTQHINVFSEINPVWYNILSGGRISRNANISQKPTIMALARANNVKVLPTIQNTYAGGAEVVRRVLEDPLKRKAHILDLVNLVTSPDNDFDGIDIDYEEMSQADTKLFSLFISELGTEMARYNKLLSVCVYYKSDNSSRYGQYWPDLVPFVDTLKVMAYNCHYSSSKPGPICPVKWLQETIEYAKQLPDAKDKIVIGLPLYGFDWVRNSGERARAVTFKEIQRIMRRYKISQNKIGWDNGESFINYWESGRSHVVYFQDSVALWERLNLVARYKGVVRGVTFWQLGGEDPEVWEEGKRRQGN